jgi:hypothetical protein
MNLPRLNRSVTQKLHLGDLPTDSERIRASPAELLQMVWPLTVAVWSFKEPVTLDSRLQRHVTRVIRIER